MIVHWAKENGSIETAIYHPEIDTVHGENINNILQEVFSQYSHTVTCIQENTYIYQIVSNDANILNIYINAKGVIPDTSEKSELYYSKALKLEPSKIEYQIKLDELGHKLKRFGRYEEAVKYYDVLTDLDMPNKLYKNKINELGSKRQNTPIKTDNSQKKHSLRELSNQKKRYYKKTQNHLHF